MKRIIFLEGNIGSGRSTLGQDLHQSGLCRFVPEPVDQWPKGLLGRFYRNQKRWAFTLQVAVLAIRIEVFSEAIEKATDEIIVLERSPQCDRNVFALRCYQHGKMTKTEWQTYCAIWDWWERQSPLQSDATAYLRTPVPVCRERIIKRNRPGEKPLTSRYLLEVEQLHDNLLLQNPKVIVLDGERPWTPEAFMRELQRRLGV